MWNYLLEGNPAWFLCYLSLCCDNIIKDKGISNIIHIYVKKATVLLFFLQGNVFQKVCTSFILSNV